MSSPLDGHDHCSRCCLEQHSKLLRENVTKHYKLAKSGDYNEIDMEAHDVAKKLQPKLSTRMEPMAKCEAYLTMKDHKGIEAVTVPILPSSFQHEALLRKSKSCDFY